MKKGFMKKGLIKSNAMANSAGDPPAASIPALILLSAAMGFVIYFFVLAGNTANWASWAYAAFLWYLFIRMMGRDKVSRYRRIFQVSFAVLFFISFTGILLEQRGSLSLREADIIRAELPFCHIAIPQTLIPLLMTGTVIFPGRLGNHFASISSMFLIWMIATLAIGRGWCSWVCFYGGWEEGFSRAAGGKPRLSLSSRYADIRAFQFAFFAFIVLISLMLMAAAYCQWFCPFKLVTEFSPVLDPSSLIAAVLFIGAFLALVVALPILSGKRTQCSALCPFGAFQSLAGRLSPYRIAINWERCRGCMACARACPFCAIDGETIKKKKGGPEITCALCGECIARCPAGAIRWVYRFEKGCPGGRGGKRAGPGPSTPDSGTGAAAEPRGPRINQALLNFTGTLVEARRVFIFSAFSFSVVISSKFGPDALNRIGALLGGG
jgi:polyferredoxin